MIRCPLSSLPSLRAHSIDPTTQDLLKPRYRPFHGTLEAPVEQPSHVLLQPCHVDDDLTALAHRLGEVIRAGSHHLDLLLQPRHQGVR